MYQNMGTGRHQALEAMRFIVVVFCCFSFFLGVKTTRLITFPKIHKRKSGNMCQNKVCPRSKIKGNVRNIGLLVGEY